MIGPELGLTLPGTTVVCGDSHTATHGAFGAFALGIGTSEVEHVLATQCLRQTRPETMEVRIEGELPIGVTAKDAALGVLNAIGTAGAAGHVVEYTGSVVRGFSMEQRMTLCNLTIEGGGRAGMIAPDDTTFAYIKRRPYAPTGAAWDEAVAAWSELQSDDGAVYDRVVHIDAATLEPTVTWGTTPAQSVPVTGRVPDPESFADAAERESAVRALAYMGLEPGTAIEDIKLDTVFIGSCTNGRIEDLRAAAAMLDGRRVHDGLRVLVVPGSVQVKAQAESEGLDAIFTKAGAEWRNPGVLDVSRHEPRHPPARRAVREHQQPQLRRTSRTRWTNAPRLTGDGGSSGSRGSFCRCPAHAGCGGTLMRPFHREDGVLIPLDRSDVDTDQIIPKQFLKRIERTGYGEFLFNDWRRDASGAPREDFVLNQDDYANGTVMVAGRNFGCGSSREHAVWALADYGIRAVIVRVLRRHLSEPTRSAAGCCR